jgi:hypothetical protein
MLSEETIMTAWLAGVDAFNNDKMEAPGLDATVRDLIKDMAVGEGALVIFSAWYNGYEAGRKSKEIMDELRQAALAYNELEVGNV